MYHLITIAIGDEIVSGQSVNTNTAQIAQKWISRGGFIDKHFMIRDDPQSFFETIAQIQNTGVHKYCVMCIGGLGPTSDDKTREMASAYFRKEMVLFEPWFELLIDRYPHIDRSLLRQQSLCFSSENVLKNPTGTALPFLLHENGNVFVFLPGVPRECLGAVDDLLTRYQEVFFDSCHSNLSRTLMFFYISERTIDRQLEGLKKTEDWSDLRWGLYPQEGALRVILKSNDHRTLDQAQIALKDLYQDFLLDRYNDDYLPLVNQKNYHFVVQETLTCGWVSSRLAQDYPALRQLCEFQFCSFIPKGDRLVILCAQEENESYDIWTFSQENRVIATIRLLKKKTLAFRHSKMFYAFLGFVENWIFRNKAVSIQE